MMSAIAFASEIAARHASVVCSVTTAQIREERFGIQAPECNMSALHGRSMNCTTLSVRLLVLRFYSGDSGKEFPTPTGLRTST